MIFALKSKCVCNFENDAYTQVKLSYERATLNDLCIILERNLKLFIFRSDGIKLLTKRIGLYDTYYS
jgi:hypothetical protein